MDNSASSHSILDTLRTVEFRLGLKGYNVDEVDEYLEKAAVEAEQTQERLRATNERLRQASERIAQLEVELQRSPVDHTVASHTVPPAAPAPEPAARTGAEQAVSDDTLQRTLVLAQKFVDQMKRESEAEAAHVVGRAEDQARTLLGQAEERARRLTTETEERLRVDVARLEETRTRLSSDVAAMSRHLEEQRTKIRASLTEALRWLDERMQEAPGQGAAARGEGRPPENAERKSEEASPGRTQPAGVGGPPVSSGGGRPGGAGTGTPLGAGAGAPSRSAGPSSAPASPEPHSSGTLPAHSPAASPTSPAPVGPERTQTPVGARLGVLNGGLFETSTDEKNGFEGNRPGE